MSRVNRHFRFECIVTAPLCHGGDESAGNVQMFRRIPMIDGSEVPAISANSLRGQLRRITARRLLELIGVESLTDLRRSHLLFSGGAIQKGEIATAHRFADIRDLRDLLPAVSLFGASWQAEILPGTLQVDWIYPDCRQVRTLLGIDGEAIDARQLTTTILYTRHDDSEIETADEKPRDKVQMLYECEALIPGTTLRMGIGVRRATRLEYGALVDAWQEWIEHPHLGGMRSRGHGTLRFTHTEEMDDAAASEYREYTQARAGEVREFLAVADPSPAQ